MTYVVKAVPKHHPLNTTPEEPLCAWFKDKAAAYRCAKDCRRYRGRYSSVRVEKEDE